MKGSRTPPISRLRGGLTVGPRFFARRDALAEGQEGAKPRGVVDHISDLSHPAIDVTRIHPDVVRFFEDTESLDLFVRSHWRFPFSIVWLLFRWVMVIAGQFVLPKREATIKTRVFAIQRDGRPDARGVIRWYADEGEDAVMQVVAYATWNDDGRRYMNAMFPLPFGSVTGILRLDHHSPEDVAAIKLTSTPREEGGERDDASVWAAFGPFVFRPPLNEQIELWAPEMASRPREIDPSEVTGCTIVGRHEQRLFGVRFVTHHYWFYPARRREAREQT